MTLDEITELVTARAKGRIKGSVRLDMPDLGALYVDQSGATPSDATADLTLTAPSDVFIGIATGTQNPATAFMMRKLKVEGNPMRALKVAEILSTEA